MSRSPWRPIPTASRDGQLVALREAGVTRVSFGLQSVRPAVLRLLDRTHGPEAALDAVAEARSVGFDHVSLDLIYGTPGETAADWEATLLAALGTGVDHVSAYALTIEPGTKLAARVRRGALESPSTDEAADRYEMADDLLSAAGFAWYEISNWARTPEARSRHNLLYWRNHHWWGVGPGAHSHVGTMRWWNRTGFEDWIGTASAGAVPFAGGEALDGTQRRLEDQLLGVRLAEGLALDLVDRPDGIAALVRDGLAERTRDRLVLTRSGRLLADLVLHRIGA